MEDEKLYTPDEAAEILGLKKRTVQELARQGKLGHFQVSDRKRYFSQQHLDEFLKRTERKPKSLDRKPDPSLPSPPKGGAEKVGHSRTDLREEMRQW